MSSRLVSSILRSAWRSQCATVGVNINVNPANLRLISTSQISHKKNNEHKPILTDDLLAKAGIDINEHKESGSQFIKQGSLLEEEGQSGKKDEYSSREKPVENEAPSETETSFASSSQKSGSASGSSRRSRPKSSTDIKREKYANIFYLGFLLAGIGSAGYLARNWEDSEDENIKDGIPNGYSLELLWKRFNARFNSIFTYFQEPPFPDLLPDSPPEPYKRPLTLVLTLEDLLIHSEWSSKTGWKTAKRPGVDYFLGYLSQYYEIVLFSSNYMVYSEKIVEKLDPLRAYISYQLYKEHCYYKDGAHIKDLSKLNRDLSKVIIVDVDENSIKLQPENAIRLPKWEGKADDELIQMIPFFEYLATQQVKDVRPILASYKDKAQIPKEFNERVLKLRSEFEKEQAKKQSANAFNKLLGLPVVKQKFPLDLIHDEGVKNYQHFQKLIREEEAKLKTQMEMPKETFKLKDIVEGNIPTQEEMMKKQLEKQLEYEQQQKTATETATQQPK